MQLQKYHAHKAKMAHKLDIFVKLNKLIIWRFYEVTLKNGVIITTSHEGGHSKTNWHPIQLTNFIKSFFPQWMVQPPYEYYICKSHSTFINRIFQTWRASDFNERKNVNFYMCIFCTNFFGTELIFHKSSEKTFTSLEIKHGESKMLMHMVI